MMYGVYAAGKHSECCQKFALKIVNHLCCYRAKVGTVISTVRIQSLVSNAKLSFIGSIKRMNPLD